LDVKREVYLREAIALAQQSVAAGGGPFGAVVVRDGQVIGRGQNRVTLDNDPTAHAEVVAIRAACQQLGSFDLRGCELYASCEPCPMCLSALLWARIDGLWYGASAADAAAAGFDDLAIYQELRLAVGERRLPSQQLLWEEAQAPFVLWCQKGDRVEY